MGVEIEEGVEKEEIGVVLFGGGVSYFGVEMGDFGVGEMCGLLEWGSFVEFY